MKFVIIDREDENSIQINYRIQYELSRNGWIYDSKNPDIVICIGGDGTILRAIHQYIYIIDSVSFVGLHTGTLGFLTDYTQNEIDVFVHDLLFNKPCIKERPLLEMEYNNKKIYAFNEIRIESMLKTLVLDVFIDGEYFEKTTGTGICISTQAGSSALNRALNGAVVDSGINVIQLCEISPISHKSHHSLKNAYIMREDRNITIYSKSKDCFIAYDHLNEKLDTFDVLKIKTSNKKARFARYRTYSYLTRLKNLY